MRRTLVSRKARKKRIAENAEMSGENFYNRQAQESKLGAQTFTAAEPTMPMVNGAPGADRLPAFTTFNTGKPDEDRQPLRSQALASDGTTLIDGASDRYYPPPSVRSTSRPPYEGPRDQFGNPVPPPNGAMMPPGRRSGEERTPAGSYREGSVPPPGSRGYGPRGRGNYPSRGGYPPRGGGYGPRGPPPPQGYPGRGGFSTEMRGSYTGRGRGGYPPAGAAGAVGGGMAAGAMMADGQRRPPPGYLPNGSERITPPEAYPDRMGPFGPIASSNPYIESAPPNRGDAISPSVYTTGPDEQLAPYGARAQSPGRSAYGSRMQSPSGTARQLSPPPAMPPMPSTQAAELPSSPRSISGRSQSQDPYVPPRAQWNNVSHEDFAQPRSPGRFAAPVELPSTGSHVGGYGGTPRRARVNSGGSDVYYEDVDPRFASDPATMPPMPSNPQMQALSVPPLLTPGQPQYRPDSVGGLPQTNSYEDLPGARSPAESETSNFTSVSQRGVNPNWRPGNGGEFSSLGPMRPRREHQVKRDVLLAGNPDFEIPGMSVPGRMGPREGRGGMRGGMTMGGGPPRIPPASAVGAGVDGRYPMGPPPPPAGPGSMREM
ncbi:regulator of ime2 [Exophiala xenobiotica]|nr:regulator of ime2 [Exophiala xenobiotica]KAK5236531.1 regulator of ime2 [Exophiala xenobiotica]KAK5252241.1 regulator of ime2 [Exophiala xenobiotica]KAK5260747.1 regulator of ime2 [Exophiala xenobiotica]KAK5350641.1 regulator of ime2 [Exophiala xenobiotica]